MKRRGETMMLPCIKQHNGLKEAEQHKIQRVECILLAIQEGCQCNDSKKLVEQLILPIIISTKQNRVLIFQGSSAFEYTRGYASGQLSLISNESIQSSLNHKRSMAYRFFPYRKLIIRQWFFSYKLGNFDTREL